MIQYTFPNVVLSPLRGDGTSIVFKFKIANLPQIIQDALPVGANPVSAELVSTDLGTATISLPGGNTIQLNFSTAPGAGIEGSAIVRLLYNSQ